MDYTIASTNCEHFNRIRVNLPLPPWKYSNVVITSFIANCNILILKKGDYITFDVAGTKYTLTIKANITSLHNSQTFIATLPAISYYSEVSLEFRVNTDETITIIGANDFSIVDLSYNMKLVLGLYYNTDFPINAYKKYDIKAVGYYLSTPVLYLLSNLGGVNYSNHSNDSSKINANSISMRLLNSFTSSMPIISSNAEFSKIVLSSDLTDFEIILVDANLHEVELLNPMYITISIANASEVMTLEDLERYEFTRKAQN